MPITPSCEIIRGNQIANSFGAGIGPKITQSVLTAAFLFAFKDVLYELSVKARQKATTKLKA